MNSLKIPVSLFRISTPEDVTQELLALAKQHCHERLAAARRKMASPLPKDASIRELSMQIGALCDRIPGERRLLVILDQAERHHSFLTTTKHPENEPVAVSLDSFDNTAIAEATRIARETVGATAVEILRYLGNGWLDIGKRPDAHQLGNDLTGRTPEELIGQLPVDIVADGIRILFLGVVPLPTTASAECWEIHTATGRSFIMANHGYVWVDTGATGGPASYLAPAARPKAGAAPIIYQVAQAFARNTGRKFTADPEGLSEFARPRRWAQMLSSATRFQDTSHLDLFDGSDYEVPGWSDGRDVPADVRRLALAEYAYAAVWFPEITGWYLTADFRHILDQNDEEVSLEMIEYLVAGERAASLTGIGEVTLRRAVISRSIMVSV